GEEREAMKTTLDTATTPLDATAAPAADLAAAQRVLELASDALAALARGLDGQLSRALDVLVAVRGRVVVTGMGKSGHVARKIAPPLARPAPPGSFAHPAGGSPGALGMITADDAVVALSNSGETAELWDIVNHARRIGIPLLAMTSAPDSELARAASTALIL